MSHSSKIVDKHQSDELISETSSLISQQLKEFVKNKYYSFDYYRRHKELKPPSKKEIFINAIVDFFWKSKAQKILSSIILFCFTVFLVEIFTKKIPSTFLVGVFILFLLVYLILLIVYSIPNNIVRIKIKSNPTKWLDLSEKDDPTKWIKLAEEHDPNEHRKIIENIGNNNSVRDIKIEEQRYKIVTISQAKRKKTTDTTIPLISFLYGMLILFVFGIPEDWENILEIATVAGFGIIPLIQIILSLFAESSSVSLLIYQHCLFILQEALIIAEERENNQKNNSVENIDEKYELILQELQNITKEIKKNKKPSSINKNTKQGSLMKELMKIKTIEAPEDFSTNFDSYLSGDKGAGTDIH